MLEFRAGFENVVYAQAGLRQPAPFLGCALKDLRLSQITTSFVCLAVQDGTTGSFYMESIIQIRGISSYLCSTQDPWKTHSALQKPPTTREPSEGLGSGGYDL